MRDQGETFRNSPWKFTKVILQEVSDVSSYGDWINSLSPSWWVRWTLPIWHVCHHPKIVNMAMWHTVTFQVSFIQFCNSLSTCGFSLLLPVPNSSAPPSHLLENSIVLVLQSNLTWYIVKPVISFSPPLSFPKPSIIFWLSNWSAGNNNQWNVCLPSLVYWIVPFNMACQHF